jgi:integrase
LIVQSQFGNNYDQNSGEDTHSAATAIPAVIAANDEAGHTVDFHALRHSFLTLLASSGVHPKVAQDLARHSDINLTMSRYSHTVMVQRSEAVDRLPDFDKTDDGKEATGTTEGK